jgi:hypothetical protein
MSRGLRHAGQHRHRRAARCTAAALLLRSEAVVSVERPSEVRSYEVKERHTAVL